MGKKRSTTRRRRPAPRTSGSARARTPRVNGVPSALGSIDAADDRVDAVHAACVEHQAQHCTAISKFSRAPLGGRRGGPVPAGGPIAAAERCNPAAAPGRSVWHDGLASMPQGLAAIYWGDASDEDVSIRVTGVRRGPASPPLPGRFERAVTINGLSTGSGRFAATIRVEGVPGGDWDITARRTNRAAARGDVQRSVVATRPWQLAYGPAVRVWSWPVLVGAGAVLAIVLQALLLARTGANVAAAVMLSVTACVTGFAGAKGWYVVLKRKHPREFFRTGACIQGFLMVAFGSLALGATTTGIGAGVLLDAATPGLFLGMAIGRPGCFLTGCCAGRPTASRWGLWSSDRAVAVKRVPVQLWEAGAALVIGAASLAVTLATGVPVAGALSVGAIAA